MRVKPKRGTNNFRSCSICSSDHSLFSAIYKKHFFRALRFRYALAFGRKEDGILSMPTQHLATPPREERVAASHVLGYCPPSR